MEFSKMLRHTFTGVDNETIDIGRVLWALGTLVFFALSVHFVWKGGLFDPIAWGTGFCAILGGGGLGLKLKENTEPKPKL